MKKSISALLFVLFRMISSQEIMRMEKLYIHHKIYKKPAKKV